MKIKIQNLTENEYIELLNTAKAQINVARNVPRNLWSMKLFYERYIDSDKKLLQAVAVLQWGHNLLLINKLGKGFAYIGNQYRLEYNGKEYFVDLLFSNRKLNCLVAIDLKIGEFKSEYVGKMNMYLSLLDKLEKRNQKISLLVLSFAQKKTILMLNQHYKM